MPGKALLLLLIPIASTHAEPRFAITKSTIDGGGNRSADISDIKGQPPRFTLTGTIGQPDAAPRLVSSSTRFSIQPGFWSEYSVVQIPDGPQLTIRKGADGYVILAWPVEVQGFSLYQSLDMSPDSWFAVLAAPVVDTATEHTVTLPVVPPRKFFKLKPL